MKGSFGKNPAVFNNAGQHYNHLHFWNWMKPNGGGGKLPGKLEKKITEDLGGLEKFKTDFAAAGVGQFGSGWCWLSVKNGKLEIFQDREWRGARWFTARPRSSAATSGSIPTTSIIATAARTISRAFVDHLVNWEYVEQLFEKA